MKKLILIAAAVLFLGSALTSCKSHTNCQAYSKVEKVKTDKTQESL
jgi:hypothetical protein